MTWVIVGAGENITRRKEMGLIGPLVAICFVSGMVVGSLYSALFGFAVVEGLQFRFDGTLRNCTGDVGSDAQSCWAGLL